MDSDITTTAVARFRLGSREPWGRAQCAFSQRDSSEQVSNHRCIAYMVENAHGGITAYIYRLKMWVLKGSQPVLSICTYQWPERRKQKCVTLSDMQSCKTAKHHELLKCSSHQFTRKAGKCFFVEVLSHPGPEQQFIFQRRFRVRICDILRGVSRAAIKNCFAQKHFVQFFVLMCNNWLCGCPSVVYQLGSN